MKNTPEASEGENVKVEGKDLHSTTFKLRFARYLVSTTEHAVSNLELNS